MEVRSMSVTIDCESCPVRGRHCGDCIVPVLGRVWLADPRPDDRPRAAPPSPAAPAGRPAALPLDFEETEALESFVRAGLVSRSEAGRVRAQSTAPSVAAG